MKNRFRTCKNGYVFDRLLLKIFFYVAFIILLAGIGWHGVNGFYSLECVGGDCLNPYFGQCDDPGLCGLEVLPEGYSYNAAPLWVDLSEIVPVFLAGLYFFVNHLKNNKGRDDQ